MEVENELTSGRGSALERARVLSQALSDAARRARFSTRTRRFYTGGGFQARRGALFIRWAIQISFYLMVMAPSVAAALYYGFFATDQYIAEAKFTVAGGAPPAIDSIGALTGIPAISIIQDTQIVANYIESRAAAEKLDELIGIRGLYSKSIADWPSRFDSTKSIEKFVRYWKRMISVSIKMPSGIVEIRVRAFTPGDAVRIAQATLDISEMLINDMNNRMNRDAVASAEQELDRTSSRLTQARISLERARNDEGLLDAGKAAEALGKLITDTRATLLRLEQEYATQRKVVSENAPQMRALKSRMDATGSQIDELESKLTATRSSSSSVRTVAASMTRFAELDLERQMAERLYAGAAASLELAQLTAETKTMYINAFVKPVLPQEPQYPKRLLSTFLVFAGSIALWGACCGLVFLVRNHMA
jgi:capsular polysaccharide transport system permease protein